MIRMLFLATLAATALPPATSAATSPGTPSVVEPPMSSATAPGARWTRGAPTESRRARIDGPICVLPAGPEYYAFDLVTTKNVPGTGLAQGRAEVSVSGSSPFSVALGPDGSYVYDIDVMLQRVKPPRTGVLVAWVTTPGLDRVERLGALDAHHGATGTVRWNKFIVVVTLEPEDDPTAQTWSGPVAFRGMSRSGMMHTMVGHGALQQENCAAYGYGS